MAGSRKGIPNKATSLAREAIAIFVEDNASRMQEWLDRIAVNDPEKAFSLFQSVIEYHIPKLARTETFQTNNAETWKEIAEGKWKENDADQG